MEEFIWAGFMVWFVFSQICFGLQWRPPPRPPFPGVTVMHMRLAMCAWPLIANGLFCYVSVFIMFIFGDDIRVPDVPLTCFVLLLAAMLGFGWGLFSEGICRAAPILGPLFHFIPWLVFLSSGIYFSVTSVPIQMATVDVYNPMLHLLEFERKAFDRSYPVSLLSLSYPATCAVVILFAGLIVNRYFRLTVHK
jgi:capsular polysaccharide transport system permease protein